MIAMRVEFEVTEEEAERNQVMETESKRVVVTPVS